MKDKIIGEVTPMLYDDSLVLALDKGWIDVFGGLIPHFIVSVDNNGKLILQSESSVNKFHRGNK